MNKTSIEWTATVTDHGTVQGYTWNPVTGCAPISPGCEHCYANTLHTARYEANVRVAAEHGYDTPQAARARAVTLPQPDCYDVRFEAVQEHPKRLLEPFSVRGGARCFTCSMADLYHAGVSSSFRARVFAVMDMTPGLTYQVLTKRPHTAARWGQEAIGGQQTREAVAGWWPIPAGADIHPFVWPLPNVWMGTSVEGARYLDRLDHLRNVPAVKRFVSFEPLIAPVGRVDLTGIDWIIIGGESGRGARPFDIDWARSLVRRAREQGVAVFVKQLGDHPVWRGRPWPKSDREGRDIRDFPELLQIREWPRG